MWEYSNVGLKRTVVEGIRALSLAHKGHLITAFLAVLVCTPPGPKSPSLRQLDSKGKCPSGYAPMPAGAEKPMYCVLTARQPRPTCKQVEVPGQAQPRTNK